MPTPNTISNHFTLTALQNGLTIQGSLRVAGTLSQNYSAGTGKCIPDWYKTDDVVESIEPAGDVPLGAWGYGYRPTVQLETHDDFKRMTAKEAIARMTALDFSEFDQGPAAEAAV